MRAQRGTHLDRRRSLQPRDYFDNPHLFGRDPWATMRTPLDGDTVSRAIAELQHRLVIAWRQHRRPSATQLCGDFAMSKQTFSRVTLGQRWAGETVLAALVTPALRKRA